jgi:hypothetical protein
LALQVPLFLRCLLTLPSLLLTLLIHALQLPLEFRARQWLDGGQHCDDFANTHPVFTAARKMSFANATLTLTPPP